MKTWHYIIFTLFIVAGMFVIKHFLDKAALEKLDAKADRNTKVNRNLKAA